jgi:hypothetical protein
MRKSTDSLLALANTVIDQIDWQVGPSLDDFLASLGMRVERDRIAALLAA